MKRFQDNTQSQLTWEDLRVLGKRYHRVILGTFLAVIAGAYLTLMCMTELYQTKASLLVKLGRENIELPTTVQATGIVTTGLRPEELNSEVQILKSRALLESVVDRLGVDAFAFNPAPPKTLFQKVKYYRKKTTRWLKERYNDGLIALNLQKRITPRDNAILTVEAAVDAMPEKTSDVVNVTVRLPGAELCTRVEQTLLELYFARRADLRRNPVESRFFTAELHSKSGALAELEHQRDSIRNQFNLSSIPEQKGLLLKQISEMESQVSNDRGSSATLQQQQSVMRSRLPALDQQVRVSEVQTLNPAVQSYKDRLSQLQLERAKLLSHYQPSSEPVRKMEEEIVSLQALVQAEPGTLVGSLTAEPNPVKRQFVQNTETNDVAIAGLQARMKELRGPIGEVQGRLRLINEGERRLEDVERQLKLAQDSYLDVARRAQEAQFHEQLDQSHMANVTMLAEPSIPIEPVYPRKLLIMAISLPVGLLLGLVLALLLHYMDDTVHTASDVTKIKGLRTLGVYRQRIPVSTGI